MSRVIVLCVILGLCFPGFRSSQARTFTVDCHGQADFDNIQAAVDAASSGDTVAISPCTYDEHVLTGNKRLTLTGAGRQSTIISWTGSEPTLQCGNQGSIIQGVTLAKNPSTALALSWQDGRLRIVDSYVQGRAVGGTYWGSIEAVNCEMGDVSVTGGQTSSTTVDSRFSAVTIGGIFLQAGNGLGSTNCHFEALGLGVLTGVVSHQDSIGAVILSGGLDIYNSLGAIGSTIGNIVAISSAFLELQGCRVGSISYGISGFPALSMQHCVVGDSCVIKQDTYPWSASPKPASYLENDFVLEHDTFLGAFSVDQPAWGGEPTSNSIRSNIFAGTASITSPFDDLLFSNNCFASSYEFNVPDPEAGHLQLFADPQFCSPTLDLRLKSTSPCLGAAHDGGDIGALGKGCGPVDVRPVTWGRLKTLYHE